MSQIKFTLIDAERALHGCPHASFVDAVVGALSAEPESIEELEAALARFIRPARRGFFVSWSLGVCDEPYDAGVCIVDLTARLVVCRSSYSSPGPRGEVVYRDDEKSDTAVWLPYHVSNDWMFRGDEEGWRAVAEERRAARSANPPLDARKILYGKVTEFIVEECLKVSDGVSLNAPWTSPESCFWRELPERAREVKIPSSEDAIAEIHARWLMTPREDLRGRTPREVLLDKKGFISWDLQDREQQWAMLGERPPGLDRSSAAFRFAGFGAHEVVLYYDLVRHLIQQCWRRVVSPDRKNDEREVAPVHTSREGEVAYLDRVREEWLNSQKSGELHGRTPAAVIEHERARLPIAMSGQEAVVDPDCPLCRMMADGLGPMFWHLDGAAMDFEFPFSFHSTREEWEEEQRRWEEFNRTFDEEWKQREAGLKSADEAVPEEETSSVWGRSFANPSENEPPAIWLFGVGGRLAELIADLKERPDTQPLIDKLNRQFANLRDVMEEEHSSALLAPVAQRFCDDLSQLGDIYPELSAKCADIERQLNEFARGPSGSDDWDASEWDDEDVPF